MRMTMKKLAQGATRLLVLALGLGLVSTAWAVAPTPTVIWDGDFSSLSKTVGGVTYSINNIGAGTDNTSVNICASDNSYLQVVNSDNGYAAPTITATGGDAPFGSSEDGATVIAFYREMPITAGSNRAVLSLLSDAVTFNSCHVNIGVCRIGTTSNTAGSFINGGQWNNATVTTQVLSGGEQMIAFTCNGDGMAYYVNGRQIATDSRTMTFTPTGVCLGGMDNSGSSKFFAMESMKILGVAIFNRGLTAEEVAEFSFSKWNASNKWRYNDTLAYREPTSGTANDFAYATVAMVGADGVADTSTFALHSPRHHPYTVLNEPNANYVSPGVALVFDTAGYKAPPQPNFGDMILGGLHVTANRADGVPYALASSTGGARTTALGDKSGYRETYFVFNESFSISRQGNQNTANTKLYGVVNVEVASGKTFTLNGNGETGNGATNIMTTAGTTAPVLKMVGGGKFKIGTLVASSGTLDFSGVTAAPFIQGALMVDDSTVFKFPAGAVFPYAVATSVNSSMSGNVTFWVGNTSYSDRTLTFTDGAVYPSGESSATFAGGNSGTWAGLDWDINYAGASGHNITVTADGTIDLGTTSATKVTFDVSDGVTLTLTGTLTASEIYINGNGVVQASAANTLQGTIKGDGTVAYTASPAASAVFSDADWEGVLWLKNVALVGLVPGNVTSANSTLRLTGCTGYFNNNGNANANPQSTDGTLDLQDDGNTKAFTVDNGWSDNGRTVFGKLTGSGTLACSTRDISQRYIFKDATQFTGSINCERTDSAGAFYLRVILGDGVSLAPRSGTITVVSGATATVAAGKTWNAWGIDVDGTLNVGAGSTIPSIVSGSEGVVQITSTGTATISGVRDDAISASLVMAGGNIAVVDTGITELTIPAETDVTFFSMADGKLNLSACTSLTTLKLNLGSVTTFDLANVILPASCTTVKVDIGAVRNLPGYTFNNLGTATLVLAATETKEEYANGTFSVVNVPSGATVSVSRADGATSNATVTDGTARFADYGTVKISGAATDLDWDFTDGTDDALEQAPAGVTKNADSIGGSKTLTFYTDAEDSTYTGAYLKHHPYVDGAASFIHNNSSAITVAAVGTMPSGSKTIFMNFGSAYDDKYGLLLANTEVANEVLVAYNYGSTVTPITTMTVPNATTARHSYIITKEDGASSTTFTVYLDGIKWKTVTTNFKIEFSSSNTGIQFGSDFGGNIRNAGYNAVSDNTGILNVLRVYGRVITPAEIATYASTFPYVSPNGSASRTFAAAAENWIDTTEASEVWNNSGEADSGTPTAGAALTVTATADTTITVNLAAETQYEALTINGSSVKFQPSSGMVKVSGMTVIGTAVTNVYGAVDMSGGPMTITEDGSICFDYSGYDASGIYSTTDATTDIPLTSDVDRNDAKVHLIAPATPYRTYSLVYESGHYAMRVTPDHEAGSEVYFGSGYLDGAMTGSGGTGTVYLETDHTHQTALFPGDTMVIDNNSSLYQDQVWVSDTFIGNIKVTRTTPMALHNGELTNPILASKTIAVEEGASLTISKHTSNALTLGALAINGAGAVALSGPLTLGGAVAGTATVTVNGSVSVSSGGSIANTVSGSGTITYAALPAAVPAGFTSWTGTVVLPTVTSGAAPLNLNSYGAVGSTVEVSGVSGSAYLANAAVTPTVHLVGDMTLSAFSATFANTFNKLSGSRAFSLTADGTAQEYADGYFLIKDVSDFTGSITVAAPGLALGGTSKPSSSEWYGKIVVQEPVTVGSGATWSASGVVLSATTATLTVPDGATVPAVASGVAGYKVDADTTTTPGLTVYSLVAKGATVSDVTFNYGDDFATATVRATVSGDATAYTLTVGGTDYPGLVDGTTVTFSNVVTGHSSAYDSVSYEITATDGTSSVVVSGGSGSAPVADVVNANWINENSTTHGQDAAGGSWTNAGAVVYSDGKAEISDNRFVATTASTASRVVLEFEVCFSSASEETVSGDAQAAIKLGEDDSVTTFKILTTGNEWASVSNAELPIEASETYNVVLTIDYGSKTYKVDVGGNALTNSAGIASFALASSSTSVQNIDFAGSGTLTSLKGSQFEGYMVKDALNNFYATIQEATQAYSSANGPYTVLHDGTPPDGWKIDEATKALIKLAKGFFFMAY